MSNEIIEDEIIEEEELLEEVVEETPSEDAQIELDRLAALNREDELRERYEALWCASMACQQLGVSNPNVYFNQQILHLKDQVLAERHMIELEVQDEKNKIDYDSRAWVERRKVAYGELDKDFMEAFAEREEGRPDKMVEYLEKRNAIKIKYPKV